jgi:large subunit ribosomal protein L4
MKAAALRGALSDRARHDRVHVVSGFVAGDAPSAKAALGIVGTAIGAQGAARRSVQVLVVAGRDDERTWKSLRNAAGVHLLDPGQLNTYDVLVSDHVIFTEAALESFVARAGRGVGASGPDSQQEESQP